MRRLLSIVLLLTGLSSCDKTDSKCGVVNTEVSSSEKETLRQYIQSHNISATEDSRGFFYTVLNTGTDDHPNICSNVVINYSGQLTNGSFFDQGNNVSFNLQNLIVGWQEGLPLIGKTGKIILYLPPGMGYGNTASGSIPPNSITIFTIELLDIK